LDTVVAAVLLMDAARDHHPQQREATHPAPGAAPRRAIRGTPAYVPQNVRYGPKLGGAGAA
jgi:hypothetical protein